MINQCESLYQSHSHSIYSLVVHDSIRTQANHVLNLMRHNNVLRLEKADLHRCHDTLNFFGVKLQYCVQNTDLVVSQGFFSVCTMEFQERAQFSLLIGVSMVNSQYSVKKACNRISDGC